MKKVALLITVALVFSSAPLFAQSAKTLLENGKKQFEQKNYDGAIEELTAAIGKNKKLVEAYEYRGLAYYNKKDYDKAIADYDEAIKLKPKDTATNTYRRGDAYFNKKDYDQAITDYTEAIKLDPKYSSAYNNRGNAYFNKKDYDKAIADYTEAIKVNPKYSNAYFYRGRAYYNKKDYDKAIADYTEAIKVNPKDTVAYYNRGDAYFNKKDYDKAITDYTEVIKLDPKNANAYNSRAWTYAYYMKTNYDKALADVNQALKLTPNDVNYLDTRGWVYLGMGDYNKAIADFEATLQIDPNYPEAKKSLENAQRLAEEKNKQVELWNGFTTDMTVKQVMDRARSLKPSEEYLVNPGSNALYVYEGDKKDLNRQFQQPESRISYKFTSHPLSQDGANTIFYFLSDKLYAVRLAMSIKGTELLSRTQKEYGNHNEVVDSIDVADYSYIRPGYTITTKSRYYSWKVLGKQVIVTNVIDADYSILVIVRQ